MMPTPKSAATPATKKKQLLEFTVPEKKEVQSQQLLQNFIIAEMRSDSNNVPRRNSISNPLHPDGVSTHHHSIRQKSAEDGELYIAGQGLVPVVNNPSAIHRSNSGSYGLLSWPASAVDKAWAEATVPPLNTLHREVSYSDFDVYRVRVGTLMDRYMHRRMSIQQDNARRLSATDPEGCGYLRGEGLVQALRQVPSLYFQEDFSLTRPETFSQVIRGETPEERNSTLETLNTALDTVETELLNEIAARSDSFFEAAESLQELQQSMGDTLFQIQRLQVHAHSIDDGMCSRAEHIQSLHKKRSALEAVLELLKTIETVTSAQDTVNLLLLAQDYPSALDLIENLKQQYEDSSSTEALGRGLERLSCLKNAPDALEASVVSLRSCLIGELLELMSWDEGESVVRSVAAKALGEEERNVLPTSATSSSEATIRKAKLTQILMGLSRTGSLSGAFSEVIPHAVSRLTASIRNAVEILLPNFVYDAVREEDSPKEPSQMEQLMQISHRMFVALLSACYSVGYACITHYSHLGEILLEATDDGSLLQHRSAVEKGRQDLCQALVDACSSQWSKLFEPRFQIHQQLSLEELEELVQMNRKHNQLAAKVHAKSTTQLGTMLQATCKAVMETQHKQNLAKLQSALEHESWKLCTVEGTTQQRLTQTFLKDEVISEHVTQEKAKVLKLGGSEYRVVHAALCLALMLCDIIRHNKSFPEFVTDIGRHVVELVTVFNKRSCQLVLGAQAMQVSGLKSITAKHLALCSQSILFFAHLQEHVVRELLDECSQAKRTILQPELNRLKQDLHTHLDGIQSKLIGIMKERVQISIDQLKDELKEIGKASEGTPRPPSQAAQQITKQLRILTQVLTPILHAEQMKNICTSVARIFSQELGSAFRDMVDSFSLHSIPVTKSDAWNEKEDAASCAHPLGEATDPDAEVAEDAIKRTWQRDQLKADCLHLIEILSQLPSDNHEEDLLQPLQNISQLLI